LEPDRFRERERLINELYSQEVSQISGDDTYNTTGDPRGVQKDHFGNRYPALLAAFERVFGPKLPRVAGVAALVLAVQWVIGGTWVLLPFVLAVAALYCLAEDTAESRKLFVIIISRLKSLRPRSS
jgi:hypothetical protein